MLCSQTFSCVIFICWLYYCYCPCPWFGGCRGDITEPRASCYQIMMATHHNFSKRQEEKRTKFTIALMTMTAQLDGNTKRLDMEGGHEGGWDKVANAR